MKRIRIRPTRRLQLHDILPIDSSCPLKIESIVVDVEQASWLVTLSGSQPPGDEPELLARLEAAWTSLAGGPKRVALDWLEVSDTAPCFSAEIWLDQLQQRFPAAAGLLRAARLSWDEGQLVAQVPNAITLERLSDLAVRRAIQETLQSLGLSGDCFRLQLCAELHDQLEAELHPSPAVANRAADSPRPDQPKRRSPRSRKPTMPLSALVASADTVEVEGEVFRRERRQLPSGRLLTTLWLTDFADSIQVKHRCPSPDCCSLAVGAGVRVSGTVSHDRFAEELVLNARRVTPVQLAKRQDTQEVKRVELHLHTKMSAMDGLCTPESLMATLARWGHDCVAITDHGVIQAFPQMYSHAAKYGIKVIFGMEGYLVEADDPSAERYHVILLVQNELGLRNLYRLVSLSHLDHYYRVPRLPRPLLAAHREGLLVGTACVAGEIYQAVLSGADDERLRSLADFYDYIELQPLENNAFLTKEGRVGSPDDLAEINRRLLALGDALGKPVVATGDVHYLEPHDELSRRVLLTGQGYSDQEHQAPLFLHTTGEMLERMAHLGPAAAYRVVVEATRELSRQVVALNPLPTGLFAPSMPGADQEVHQRALSASTAQYGDPLPELVQQRLARELEAIIGQGYAGIYAISSQLVARSRQAGYLVGSRGSVGSSLVATMCGITEVNPLVPHYYCARCKYTRFLADGTMASGFDLPVQACPHCGEALFRDGQDIPFETFMGFEGDKVPDIDLNFSGEYQAEVHRQAETILGDNRVYRAGTIATLAEKTAYGFVKGYLAETGLEWKRAHIDYLVAALTGVKRTTGQHPGGLMIVPAGFAVEDFSPVQYPADDRRSGVITTHFDYQAVHDNLVKLDLLGHDDPTSLRMLQELTGVDPLHIPFDDPATLAIFSGLDSLGLHADDWELQVGTMGIPEFGTRFVRKMLLDTRPRTFSELVRVSGLSHGTDVWLNNAQELIKKGKADISQVISSRDDITVYLIYRGLAPNVAFSISEAVRKGRGLSQQEVRMMEECGVSDWYIASCQKIKYLFPKAHAVAYVMMAFRVAYFKVHYPLAFYAAYFSTRALGVDGSLLLEPQQWTDRLRDGLSRSQELTAREADMCTHLEVALEMQKRGFRFLAPRLYASDTHRFLTEGNALLMPFVALPGMGQSAAHKLVQARGERPFLSIEDMRARTRLSRNLIELLSACGCLTELPERNQLSLFADP